MNLEKFLEHLNSGKEVPANSDILAYMTELSDDNKRYIKKIFKDLGDSYRFNEKIINDL